MATADEVSRAYARSIWHTVFLLALQLPQVARELRDICTYPLSPLSPYGRAVLTNRELMRPNGTLDQVVVHVVNNAFEGALGLEFKPCPYVEK